MARPVVHLSFGSGDFTTPGGFREDLSARMEDAESEAGFTGNTNALPARLRRLLAGLHHRSCRRTVVLVDEHDKPILNAIRDPDPARSTGLQHLCRRLGASNDAFNGSERCYGSEAVAGFGGTAGSDSDSNASNRAAVHPALRKLAVGTGQAVIAGDLLGYMEEPSQIAQRTIFHLMARSIHGLPDMSTGAVVVQFPQAAKELSSLAA